MNLFKLGIFKHSPASVVTMRKNFSASTKLILMMMIKLMVRMIFNVEKKTELFTLKGVCLKKKAFRHQCERLRLKSRLK